MVLPNFLLDPTVDIVLDTSVCININASGFAADILNALPNRILVLNHVVTELEGGRKNGSSDADDLRGFIQKGLVELKQLNIRAMELFEQLVIGPAHSTLDDGESATIAYADSNNAIAIIDERKAHRICKERFSSLSVACTIDLLAHPTVKETLGRNNHELSIVNALEKARMRVFPEHVDWIIKIIGAENVAKYPSLPRFVRLS